MNLTLKKVVNLALALIISDLLLNLSLEIFEGKDFPSLRRLRIISKKV